MRLRTLQERVGGTSKEFGAIRAAAGGDIRRVIIAAALGKAPADRPTDAKQFRSHATIWFKSEKGGRELANKVFDLHLWPTLKPQLLPFCNAVLAALELPQIVDIDP